MFFRIDGTFYALLDDDHWLGIDDEGQLLCLHRAYAQEVGRMIDLAEVIEEYQFVAELAEDAAIPSGAPTDPPPPQRV